MKKLLISVLLSLSFIAAPVFSFEWGGVFRDETGASISDITKIPDISAYSFNQSNSLYLWANKAITEDSKWYLSTEAYYKFKLTSASGVNTVTHIIDMDLLKLTGQVVSQKTVFNLAAGRFFVMDNTASIFTQTCDGLSVKFSFPFMDMAVYSGFTGLLNNLSVTMLDATSYATPSIGGTSNVYSLSHPYVPLIISAEFPTFAGVQTLGVQASAFLDLDANTKYNRFYGNIMMKGPIISSIFYSVNTTFGFPNFQEISNLTEFTLSGYAGDNVGVYASVKYASGEQLIFKSFRGVTSNPAYGALNSPELSGVLIPALRVVFLFNNINIDLNTKYVLACPKATINFAGLEFDLATSVNIFSDLQLGFSFQGFISLSPFEGNGGDSNYKANINLSFAF